MQVTKEVPFSQQIKGPHRVKFLQGLAASDIAFRIGDEFSVSKHYYDAWIASGICRPAEDDAADLKKQIDDLEARLKAIPASKTK